VSSNLTLSATVEDLAALEEIRQVLSRPVSR
jgi:hypothetical protein